MIEALHVLTPYFKAAHILALSVWCGGLLALPLMMAGQHRAVSSDDYRRIRLATHLLYTLGVTPSGVVAVISGTWLIFLRETFEPWFYVKLLFVTALVGAHIWVGRILVNAGDTSRETNPPAPLLPILAILAPALAVLYFVLAKPDLGGIQFPSWLSEPVGGKLPFAVPRL